MMARGIPVIIGDREYATKLQALEAIRHILYKYEPPAIVGDPEHILFLTDLLAMHPEAKDKIGVGVHHFEVQRNMAGTHGFHVVRVDGVDTDFSFVKIIHTPKHDARVRVALRRAIVDQVLAARDEAFRERDTLDCPVTGEPITVDTCHVDHDDPTFVELAHRFAAQVGGYELIKVVTEDGANGTRLVDQGMENHWQHFHADNANLRVVSVRANLSLLRRGVPRV